VNTLEVLRQSRSAYLTRKKEATKERFLGTKRGEKMTYPGISSSHSRPVAEKKGVLEKRLRPTVVSDLVTKKDLVGLGKRLDAVGGGRKVLTKGDRSFRNVVGTLRRVLEREIGRVDK